MAKETSAWRSSAFGVRAAGLLILFASAYEMTRVTSARLRRLRLAMWDPPFTAAVIAATGASVAWHVAAAVQNALAGALIVYAAAASAALFHRTVVAIRA